MKIIKISEEMLLPLRIKHYLSKMDIISIITDIKFHDSGFDYEKMGKREILRHVKNHMRHQGKTVYPDWYEDTDSQHEWNGIYEKVNEYISQLFKELLKQNLT